MADLPGQVALSVAFIALFVMVSQIDCLSIIEHLVKPQEIVTNCSAVRLVCVVDTPDVNVWWTFGGENASKLPNVTILSNESGEWQLEIYCATLVHKGSYICNAQTRNESEIVYRKEAILRIYVPAIISVGQAVTAEIIDESVNQTCTVHAYPLAFVDWLKDGITVNTTDGHIQVNTVDVDNATVQSKLYIDSIDREDNGTYTCIARNEFNNASAIQVLLVQESPEVEFLKDSIIIEDPSTVSLQWQVVFDGNLPVQSFHLQKENLLESERVIVDKNIPSNITTYTLYSLFPGLMYTFYISAENIAGISSWDSVNVSLPPDVPPKVSWIHVLGSTNETLLFGWRRPNHDNGANITHYAVKLRHNGELIENKTMNIQDPGRNNLMVLFVTLEAGETYIFRVQACNVLGCGNWSDALNGTTSDGFADPPRNIEVKCENNPLRDSEYIIVTWDIPKNARGKIINYNLTILSTAQFRDESGQQVEEKTMKVEIIDVNVNQLEYTMNIQPNTEYTVQMCTINRGGCGPMSNITANSCCMSASNGVWPAEA